MKKKLIALILCVMTVFAFSACGGDPVATVNGVDISEETYQEYLNYTMAMYGMTGESTMSPDMAEFMQSQTIDSLIYTEELRQACEAEGCLPTAEEEEAFLYLSAGATDAMSYSQALQSIEAYYGLSKDTFELISLGQLYVDSLATQLAENKGLTVADEEAEEAYNEAPEEYNTRTVSHILIMPEVTEGREAELDESGNTIYTEEEWAAAKKEAMEVIGQLNEGADFAELAVSYSDDGSAQSGGALGGSFTEAASPYVEEFTEASFKLNAVDEYTLSPVKTVYGYHIILCTGVQDADNDFETLMNTIKEGLLNELKQAAVDEYIAEFDENSEIVIYYGSNANAE